MKFTGMKTKFQDVLEAPTPLRAKQLGKRKSNIVNWDELKFDVMLWVIQLKVSQNPEVLDVLVSTGDRNLVEDAPRDYVWGCGRSGTGTNKLGRILMTVREQVKKGELKDVPQDKQFDFKFV